MEIRYNDALKKVGTIDYRGMNLAANNLYANEEWLNIFNGYNESHKPDNEIDYEIDGEELFNFAKHIDTSGDGIISEKEVQDWIDSNSKAGNALHERFDFGMIAEIFGFAIDEAKEEVITDADKMFVSYDGGDDGSKQTGSGKRSNAVSASKRIFDFLESSPVSEDVAIRPKSSKSINIKTPSKEVKETVIGFNATADGSKVIDLSKLKNQNAIVQNLYAFEGYLDSNYGEPDKAENARDRNFTYAEIINFLSHIDTSGDGKITYQEFEDWQRKNANDKNKNYAHADFTYDELIQMMEFVNAQVKS